jgi:hypothetical protein
VRFSADLHVLRPVDAVRGNGVLLFELANRGNKFLPTLFNRAPQGTDPMMSDDVGDGLLMRDGYTIVWVGWQFVVPPGALRLVAPPWCYRQAHRRRAST